MRMRVWHTKVVTKNSGYFYFYHVSPVHIERYRSARGTRFNEGEYEQNQKLNQDRSEYFCNKRRSDLAMGASNPASWLVT